MMCTDIFRMSPNLIRHRSGQKSVPCVLILSIWLLCALAAGSTTPKDVSTEEDYMTSDDDDDYDYSDVTTYVNLYSPPDYDDYDDTTDYDDILSSSSPPLSFSSTFPDSTSTYPQTTPTSSKWTSKSKTTSAPNTGSSSSSPTPNSLSTSTRKPVKSTTTVTPSSENTEGRQTSQTSSESSNSSTPQPSSPTAQTSIAPSATTDTNITTEAAAITTPTTSTSNPRFCSKIRPESYRSPCQPCSNTVDDFCMKGYTPRGAAFTCGPRFRRFSSSYDNFRRRRSWLPFGPRQRRDLPGLQCFYNCYREVKVEICCHGYWGSNCDECPGGHDNPCNDKGQCQENGTCICEQGFKGTACEMCAESTKYGPDCALDCQCLHGECNSGRDGDGSCDCHSGFKGDKCDIGIHGCYNLTCGENWRCVEDGGLGKCVCAAHYKFNETVNECVVINPCEAPEPPCAANSTCEMLSPEDYRCTCKEGYKGDGVVCLPIDPCQKDNGNCGQNTVCLFTGPNQHECRCLPGFENHVPGSGCTMTDMCTRGTCDANADCKTIEPLTPLCTCREGYAGNGTVCYGDILERLKDMNSNHPKLRKDLQYAINLISRFYKEPLTKHGPFTLFVPNDRAFRGVIRANKGFQKFLEDEDRVLQILRQHILIGKFQLKDLQNYDRFYTLQGNEALLQIRVARDVFKYKLAGHSAKAKVVERNVIASNGVIHVVNNLLTLQPEISGDPKKTAMDLIQKEPKYNRFETLISSAGLADFLRQPNITVFAPENDAWDSLPAGTWDFLTNHQEGKERLRLLLLNHVFSGVIGVTHILNMPVMTSYAINTTVIIGVTSLGRIQLDGRANVTQVNIPCSNGMYHHIDGLLVPAFMDPIMPNFCPKTVEIEVAGRCWRCSEPPECHRDTDRPTTKITQCKYRTKGYQRVKGCAVTCLRDVVKSECCDGFSGSQCLPCPGGITNPCNGRGKCSGWRDGSVRCTCDDNLTGTACERCQVANMFGPNCNETCTCMHGRCNDGPEGSGKCVWDSCYEGYVGEDCDKKLLECGGDTTLCHAHARCFVDDQNIASCKCDMGYKGDGRECWEVNPCLEEENGGCSKQATCTKIGPGMRRCDCIAGWQGDGFSCVPKPWGCYDNADCHMNATCIGPDQEPTSSYLKEFFCACNPGFTGNGRNCDLVDICMANNGGCYVNATCSSLDGQQANCTCPEDMEGDGITCYGTIAYQVMNHPNLTKLAGFLQLIDERDNILNQANNTFTFFAPSDQAMGSFLTSFSQWNKSAYWQQEENIIWFFNFHTLDIKYTTKDFLAYDGVYSGYPTLYDGFSLHIVDVNKSIQIMVNHSDFARVTTADMPAINGYLHIIDKVLEPFFPDEDAPDLSKALAARPEYEKFFEALLDTDVFTHLQDLDEYTVFVPTNDAMEDLNRTATAEYLKYYILPQLVFTPSLVDNDKVGTLLGQQHQLVFRVNQNKIKVNGVDITKADILIDGGVLHEISGLLHPVLHRCDLVTQKVIVGECVDCKGGNRTCPPGYSPLPPSINYYCAYRTPSGAYSTGCQQKCYSNITTSMCCGGYYGPKCEECPGGAELPCLGNGRCSDGLTGSGACTCDTGFSGAECGVCASSDLVPPFCNVTYNSCGYLHGNCSAHAACKETSGGVSCRCLPGYVGDGYTCSSVCDTLDNGGCHPQADCSYNGSLSGFQCTCKQHYHGNGTWCEENINPCLINHGGCDPDRAFCNFMPPKVTDMIQGAHACDCKDGYVGNGTLCSTDLLDAVSRIPELDYFYGWIKEAATSNISNLSQVLANRDMRITLFAPLSWDWQAINLDSLVVVGKRFRLPPEILENLYYEEDDSDDNDDDEGEDYIKQWTLTSLDDQLINVTINSKGRYYVNDVRVVDRNIETLNGILHITRVPIVSYESVNVQKSTGADTSNNTVLIACVVVAVIVVVVVVLVVAAVVYSKKKQQGLFDIFKRSQSSSESNLSFARLSAQEADEDSFQGSDTAKYDNPLFNDRDVL